MIRGFFNKAKEKRAEIKILEVETITGISINEWVEALPNMIRNWPES